MKWEYKVSEPYNLTNEEAINAIEKNMPLAGTYTVLTEALHMAIKALRKQEPVKPTTERTRYGEAYDCNVCNCGLEPYNNYCPNCGQRIDWTEG